MCYPCLGNVSFLKDVLRSAGQVCHSQRRHTDYHGDEAKESLASSPQAIRIVYGTLKCQRGDV